MVAFEDFQSKPESSEADAGVLFFFPKMLITVISQITGNDSEFQDLTGRRRLSIFSDQGRELVKAQVRKWDGQRSIPAMSLCFDVSFSFGVKEKMVLYPFQGKKMDN